MNLKRCVHGHFYDGDKHAVCPKCGEKRTGRRQSLAGGGTDSGTAERTEKGQGAGCGMAGMYRRNILWQDL